METKYLIESERLLLRPFDVEDAQAFYELNLDTEVMRYTGDIAFEDVEASARLIKTYDHYAKYGYGRWTVVRKEDMAILGWCGLKNHPEEGYVDLGYRFHRSVWGNGYATEAAKACVDYGFNQLGMTEVVGRTAKENVASVRVLEKIGMQFWKEAPCEGIENSVFYRVNLDDT